jgi:hypothetical protein
MPPDGRRRRSRLWPHLGSSDTGQQPRAPFFGRWRSFSRGLSRPALGGAAIGATAKSEVVLTAFLHAEVLKQAGRWQTLDQLCSLRTGQRLASNTAGGGWLSAWRASCRREGCGSPRQPVRCRSRSTCVWHPRVLLSATSPSACPSCWTSRWEKDRLIDGAG